MIRAFSSSFFFGGGLGGSKLGRDRKVRKSSQIHRSHYSRKDLRPRRKAACVFSVRAFGNALLGYAAAKPNNHPVDKISGY